MPVKVTAECYEYLTSGENVVLTFGFHVIDYIYTFT